MPDETYNPLAKQRLAESVAQALLDSPVARLEDVGTFDGAGIYAIYYHGEFEPYLPVAAGDQPIYVGKAVPKGGRKGGWGLGLNPGNVLANRLRQHARSVEDATNLDLADFSCRYLVVDDVWIPLAESLLIERFSPIWNTVLDGFGNHDPGIGSRAGNEDMVGNGIGAGILRAGQANECVPHRVPARAAVAEARSQRSYSSGTRLGESVPAPVAVGYLLRRDQSSLGVSRLNPSPGDIEFAEESNDYDAVAELRHTVVCGIDDPKANIVCQLVALHPSETFVMPEPVFSGSRWNGRLFQLGDDVMEVREKALARQASHILQYERLGPQLPNSPDNFGEQIPAIVLTSMLPTQ